MATIFAPITNVDVGTTLEDMYTAPASTTSSITSLLFCNKTNNNVTIDIQVVRSGGSPIAYILKGGLIPANDTLEAINNKPLVLSAGDKIRAICNTASAVDLVGSVMEQS